jgi:putative transposase
MTSFLFSKGRFLAAECGHYGLAAPLTVERQVTLQAAYELHPERFVNGQPIAPKLPTTVWINPPLGKDEEQ